MRKDSYHIEMEDLSPFHVERSRDCEEWEDVLQDELNDLLDQVPDDRARNFLSVVRGGGTSLFGRYFYRIRPKS